MFGQIDILCNDREQNKYPAKRICKRFNLQCMWRKIQQKGQKWQKYTNPCVTKYCVNHTFPHHIRILTKITRSVRQRTKKPKNTIAHSIESKCGRTRIAPIIVQKNVGVVKEQR